MLLSEEEVKEFLPHRDPFLFIDSVESVYHPVSEYEHGKLKFAEMIGGVTTAVYTTKEDHAIFAGHFPGFPIFPGVTQIEMMAQATAFVLLTHDADIIKKKLDLTLLSVSGAKFRKPVLPNMTLTVRTECKKIRGKMLSYDCQCFHHDKLMSEASVMASVVIGE